MIQTTLMQNTGFCPLISVFLWILSLSPCVKGRSWPDFCILFPWFPLPLPQYQGNLPFKWKRFDVLEHSYPVMLEGWHFDVICILSEWKMLYCIDTMYSTQVAMNQCQYPNPLWVRTPAPCARMFRNSTAQVFMSDVVKWRFAFKATKINCPGLPSLPPIFWH